MRCATCGGTAHPATGSQYTETLIVCGPCARVAWAWVVQHTKLMVSVSFYEAATKRVA